MNKHYGHLVEKVVRGEGYSISALAIQLKINRRSIYNWFNQEELKQEIIYRIGITIGHDFYQEFPELFTESDFSVLTKNTDAAAAVAGDNQQNMAYWKEKYIELLEKYNEVLNEMNKINRMF